MTALILALGGCVLERDPTPDFDEVMVDAEVGDSDTGTPSDDTGSPADTDGPDTGSPPDTDRPDTDSPPDTDRPDTGSPPDTDRPDTGSARDTGIPDPDTGPSDTGPVDPVDPGMSCPVDALELANCTTDVAAWNTSTSTRYTLVQAAIDDASSGDTLAICPGTWPENLLLPAIELTLRGYGDYTSILDGGGFGRGLSVESGAELSLLDLAVVNANGAGVFAPSADLLTCGVRFEGNFGDYGGGLELQRGTWTGENVSFIGNHANFSGGGAALGVVTTRLVNATFTDNYASADDPDGDNGGGGLYLATEGSAQISDSEFERNHSELSGGGIHTGGWTTGGEFTLLRVTFTANDAAYSGGAISAQGWSLIPFTLNECTLTRNSAGYQGGAVSLPAWGGVNMAATDSSFEGNTSVHGGGFCLSGWGPNTLSLDDSTLTGNVAEANGGAISANGRGDSWIDLMNTTVTHNTAPFGGAFALGYGGFATFSMTDGGATSNISSRVRPAGYVLGLGEDAVVSVTNSDWGEGAADNLPFDARGYVAGTSATFSCSYAYCY